jgi:hypothetical protein
MSLKLSFSIVVTIFVGSLLTDTLTAHAQMKTWGSRSPFARSGTTAVNNTVLDASGGRSPNLTLQGASNAQSNGGNSAAINNTTLTAAGNRNGTTNLENNSSTKIDNGAATITSDNKASTGGLSGNLSTGANASPTSAGGQASSGLNGGSGAVNSQSSSRPYGYGLQGYGAGTVWGR